MLKTNNKQVRASIKAHILETYENDIDNLKHDYNSQGSFNELVQAGCFLCYYSDVRKFLQEILEETDEEANKYDDEKVWNLYKALITMEGQKIINK